SATGTAAAPSASATAPISSIWMLGKLFIVLAKSARCPRLFDVFHHLASYRVEIDFDVLACAVLAVHLVAIALRRLEDVDAMTYGCNLLFHGIRSDPLGRRLGRAMRTCDGCGTQGAKHSNKS